MPSYHAQLPIRWAVLAYQVRMWQGLSFAQSTYRISCRRTISFDTSRTCIWMAVASFRSSQSIPGSTVRHTRDTLLPKVTGMRTNCSCIFSGTGTALAFFGPYWLFGGDVNFRGKEGSGWWKRYFSYARVVVQAKKTLPWACAEIRPW